MSKKQRIAEAVQHHVGPSSEVLGDAIELHVQCQSYYYSV
jgi:hypothetical protein